MSKQNSPNVKRAQAKRTRARQEWIKKRDAILSLEGPRKVFDPSAKKKRTGGPTALKKLAGLFAGIAARGGKRGA